jgi:plasmid stabilization system protein ParE
MPLLTDFPMIGHEGALQGTREMVVPGLPYIIVHRVEPAEAVVVILGVYHGAQRRPGQERP